MNYEIKNTEFDQNSSKENHFVNFLALSLGLCVGAIVLFVVFGDFVFFQKKAFKETVIVQEDYL